MKIEVNTRGSKEFYDEMLFVVTYCKKILENPHKKAWRYTNYLLMYMSICVIMCGAFVALQFMDNEWYYLVMIGAFVLLFFFIVVLFANVKKRIKMYMDDKSDKVIEVTEDCISYSSDTMNLKMNKEDIGVIVINKYSICVLPKEMNKYAISICNDYLVEFLKATSENGYDKLVVDNRKK